MKFSFKKLGKGISKGVTHAVKETKHVAKHVAKKAKHDVKHVAKKAEHGAKHVASKAKNGAKNAAKKVKHAAKKVAKKVKKATKKVKKLVKKTAQKVAAVAKRAAKSAAAFAKKYAGYIIKKVTCIVLKKVCKPFCKLAVKAFKAIGAKFTDKYKMPINCLVDSLGAGCQKLCDTVCKKRRLVIRRTLMSN